MVTKQSNTHSHKYTNHIIVIIAVGLQYGDHFEIYNYLKELNEDQICTLGGALGLVHNNLKKMKTHPQDMVTAWLRQEDKVTSKSGKPTWRSLVKALREVGQEGVARKIEQKHSIVE